MDRASGGPVMIGSKVDENFMQNVRTSRFSAVFSCFSKNHNDTAEGGGRHFFAPQTEVEPCIQSNNYLNIFILMKSSSKQVGGTSIEDIAEADPTAIIKVPVDIMKVIFSSISSTFKTFFSSKFVAKTLKFDGNFVKIQPSKLQ